MTFSAGITQANPSSTQPGIPLQAATSGVLKILDLPMSGEADTGG
jgi:hypothetical protein